MGGLEGQEEEERVAGLAGCLQDPLALLFIQQLLGKWHNKEKKITHLDPTNIGIATGTLALGGDASGS